MTRILKKEEDVEQRSEKNAEKTYSISAEKTYSIRALRGSCAVIFNVSTATFDGALHDCTAESLTINEARTLIDSFLNKKIGGK